MTIVSTDPPRYYVYVYRSKLQYTVVTNDNVREVIATPCQK